MEISKLINQLFENRIYLGIVFLAIAGFFFMYNRKGGRKMFLAVLVLLLFYFLVEAWFYNTVIIEYVIPFIRPYFTQINAYIYKGNTMSLIFPYLSSIFAFWVICLIFLKRHIIFMTVISCAIVVIIYLLKADLVIAFIVAAIGSILGLVISKIINERFYVNRYYNQLD